MHVRAPSTATPTTSDASQATHACTRQVQQYGAGAMTASELYAWVEKHRAMGADLTHSQILQELPATRRADYWRVMQGQGGSIPDAGILGPLEGIRSETKPGDFSASAPSRPGLFTQLRNFFLGPKEPEIFPLRRQRSNLDLARQITDGSGSDAVNLALPLVHPEDRPALAKAFSRMGGMHAPVNRADIALQISDDDFEIAEDRVKRQRAEFKLQPGYPAPGPDSREKIQQKGRVIHAQYEAQASPVGVCSEMAHDMMQDLIERGVPASRLFHCAVTHPESQTNHMFIAYSPNELKPLESENSWPIVVIDPWATRDIKLFPIHNKEELDCLATAQLRSAGARRPITQAAFNYDIN